jgi:hypothetical protein
MGIKQIYKNYLGSGMLLSKRIKTVIYVINGIIAYYFLILRNWIESKEELILLIIAMFKKKIKIK